MSPTRRDILKYLTITPVAAALPMLPATIAAAPPDTDAAEPLPPEITYHGAVGLLRSDDESSLASMFIGQMDISSGDDFAMVTVRSSGVHPLCVWFDDPGAVRAFRQVVRLIGHQHANHVPYGPVVWGPPNEFDPK